MSPIRVANAPCSYGAFEITVGRLPNIPDALDVLQSMSDAGYEGTELGPPGYLGDRDELHDMVVEAWLTRAQKRVAKAWLQEHGVSND